MKPKKQIKCPRCGKKNTWKSNNPYRPFCSERCKLIDLGKWADEEYKIPSQQSNEYFEDKDEKL